MQRTPIRSAQPGMVIATPVFHTTRHDQVLMRPGVALTTPSIDRLIDTGVRYIWTESPNLEEVERYVSVGAIQSQAALLVELESQFERVRTDPRYRLKLDPLRDSVDGIISRLAVAPDLRVWAHEPSLPDQPMLRNAVFVGNVSIAVARLLDWYLIRERPKLPASNATDVRGLGLAALLHDVGMLRLEPHVVENWQQTHDDTDLRWRRHVRLGYDLLRHDVEPSAAAAILNHHQTCDGTGFPVRVNAAGAGPSAASASQIHIFARIIHAADAFDRMRHPPGTDRAEPRVRVLRRMLSEAHASNFDAIVLQALTRVVPPFPPGARVTLSDGRVGTVTGLNAASPCRPPITLDPHVPEDDAEADSPRPPGDARIETIRERIDLDSEPELLIAKIDDQDVLMDNFTLDRPAETEEPREAAA